MAQNVRIVEGDQNVTPITAASVRSYARSNPITVVLVNASGDAYNANQVSVSGGDGALLDGIDSGIKATVKDYVNSNPLTVVLVNSSGDAYNANSVNVAVSKWNLTPNEDSVRIHGGIIGVSGDVSTTPKAGETWPISSVSGLNVREQDKTGVHVSSGQIGITGDVTLQQNSNRIIGRIEGPIGVQVVGGSGGGTIGVSGDVATTQKGAVGVAISGDSGVTATVRDYTNSNPIAVALTNASGDTYNPVPKEPICTTLSGRITSAGSTTLAGGYAGRVIKVSRYEVQSESADSMLRFSSGASGDPLTLQWILGAREGVVEAVSAVGGGYLFRSNQNQALVIEHFDTNPIRYSVTFHSGDAI